MIVYKLTDSNGYTRRGQSGETLWAPGTVRKTEGNGPLCSKHWTHAYEHPILAVLHDPVCGCYGSKARLWECDTLNGVIQREGQMKLGATSLCIIREINKPEVTMGQRTAYAILCSLKVYSEESFVSWAEGWLSGRDRSEKSASAALTAVKDALTAKKAAEWSAWAAMEATWATKAVTWAPSVPTATAAANAVDYAVRAQEDLDLISCAREVYLIN